MSTRTKVCRLNNCQNYADALAILIIVSTNIVRCASLSLAYKYYSKLTLKRVVIDVKTDGDNNNTLFKGKRNTLTVLEW